MPREQINTPRHRFVRPVYDTPDGNLPVLVDGADTVAGASVVGVGYRYPNDGEGLVDGETWEHTPALHIGWHGDGINTQVNGDPADAHLDVFVEIHCDELLRIADGIRRTRETFPDGEHNLPAMHRIEIATLTRPEAQKLIRVVKRARDAVFGADE